MPEGKEQPKIAPEFANMGHFNAEINEVGYARYNYKELIEREAKLASMIEGARDVALFNSGAAAMHSVIEAEGLKAGDTVLCANAIYGTTKAGLKNLESMGIRVIIFDSTNNEEIKNLVAKVKPRLIVVESIANSQNMEVTDLQNMGHITEEANKYYQEALIPEKILSNFIDKRPALKGITPETKKLILSNVEEYKQGQNPFIFRQAVKSLESETGLSREDAIRELSKIVKKTILDSREKLTLIIDNTLPSPQLINPLKNLSKFNIGKVIVESGTKHYQQGANEITFGIAYSDDAEKMQAIKSRRIELGTYLQPLDERKIPETIQQTMQKTMNNHGRNALKLARELSGIIGFEVAHPNLPEHKQSEIVNNLAPDGAVTLFYITVPNSITGEQFMQKIKDVGGNLVGLGSSFGHVKTWLSNYGMDTRTVRIAVGSENEQDFEKVVFIFKKVAAEFNALQSK